MRFAVFGNPIAQSRSPQIQTAFAAQFDLPDFDYGRILAPLDGFAAALREFIAQGGVGCNITMPFKEDAFRASTRVTERAAAAGVVNTIQVETDGTLLGDNTDGAGLVADLLRHTALAGQRILLLGAGGAARGVLLPLAAEQPARIVIANRTAAKAEALAQEFSGRIATPLAGTGFGAIAGEFDVVINATAAGFAAAALPLPGDVFAAGCTAYEMVYGKGETAFLAQARAAGCKLCLDGLGMLVCQGAESFRLWTGLTPNVEPVLAMVRAELAA